jgi:hypothetical protein
MPELTRPRDQSVLGPDGRKLTVADLPRPGAQRWTLRRKAEVVAAVRGGLLSQADACHRYMLSVEEFLSWEDCMDRHGFAGWRDDARKLTTLEQENRRLRKLLADSVLDAATLRDMLASTTGVRRPRHVRAARQPRG